ncbi:hypothetical protein GGI35DRAFT_288128 [Trichoderma velutinum]
MFAIPDDMKDKIENLSRIAEAYHCAVIARLHGVIDVLEGRGRDGTVYHMYAPFYSAINWASLRAMLPVNKDQALADYVAAVERVPLGCPEEDGLLPLLSIMPVLRETNRQFQGKEEPPRMGVPESDNGPRKLRCGSELLQQGWFGQKTYDWRKWLLKVHQP